MDPFVGGGSVLLATPAAVPAVVNDACRDLGLVLVGLYSAVASQDLAFRQAVTALAAAWDGLAQRENLFTDIRVPVEGAGGVAQDVEFERLIQG